MKLIINKRQYSLLVEQTVQKISFSQENVNKYCSPVKVSANIINSNMDKFININQFNNYFDKKDELDKVITDFIQKLFTW